jgi:hypothetical protein
LVHDISELRLASISMYSKIYFLCMLVLCTQGNMMFVVLLWLSVHPHGESWKVCLITVGIEPARGIGGNRTPTHTNSMDPTTVGIEHQHTQKVSYLRIHWYRRNYRLSSKISPTWPRSSVGRAAGLVS